MVSLRNIVEVELRSRAEMDGITELLKSTYSNGLHVPDNVEFFYSCEKGICCKPTRDIKDLKFQLPNRLIISNSLSTKHFSEFIRVTDSPNTWLKLLIAKIRFSGEEIIIENENIRELFGTYVRSLPSIVDSPLMWNPSELEKLSGTNLLNSLKEKWNIIYQEWRDAVQYISTDIEEYNLESLSFEEIYNSIVLKSLDAKDIKWFSFSAFLWAHLIFTSRAFPERVISPNCCESSVILLPVLDLLNHANRTKVEWSSNEDGDFIFRFDELLSAGVEITNNYGAKGNEELLLGYGFVLEDNEFDSFALKIKLPRPILEKLVEANVFLPKLDDYTTFAFERNTSQNPPLVKDISAFQDGLLYFVTHNLESLKPLLQLFAHLSTNEKESPMTLRCQLTSIQTLRNSLKYKLSALVEASNNFSSEYDVADYRKRCATIYKTGQISTLESCLANLKTVQKHIMKNYRSHLATIANILKYDLSFSVQFSELFKDQPEVPVLENEFENTVAWIALRSKRSVSLPKYGWIIEQFIKYKSDRQKEEIRITPAAEELYEYFFPNGHLQYDTEYMQSILDYINNFAYMKCSNSTTSDFDQVPVLTKHLEISFL